MKIAEHTRKISDTRGSKELYRQALKNQEKFDTNHVILMVYHGLKDLLNI